ncbi:MAG: hypothetical protein KDA94_16670, partial [Acidimicrobiales bacterium]|nr:hypothetical protein [Acidimicrobiales bacterium]
MTLARMNVARTASWLGRWIAENASRDFCPWANKYVYWLKEPIGWFVLATLSSVLIGIFLSPLGWTLAAGLVAIIALGLGFPLIAVASLRCQLTPVNTELSEGEGSYLTLLVSNRLPFPVMGLMIEGYLAAPPLPGGDEWDSGLDERGECGLARVPGWSRANYRL